MFFRTIHATCFGVLLPGPAVDDRLTNDRTFFEYAVEPVVVVEAHSSETAVLDSIRLAVGRAVQRTFGDCEPSLVAEVKTADDPAAAWLVLADWLEERNDRRASWIRSHRLDLVAKARPMARQFVTEEFAGEVATHLQWPIQNSQLEIIRRLSQ